MPLKDAFIISEAGPFTVHQGGKSAGEPSDPQGNLYSADQQMGPTEQLITAIDYVVAKLKEQREELAKADEQQAYRIKLDLMDTASDLNWALNRALEQE